MSENPNALKHMYNQALLDRMASAITSVYPQFEAKTFRQLMPKMKRLEMKPRVVLLREELRQRLPEDYKTALRILLASLKSGELKGFDLWPYTEFVQTYGLNDLKASLTALKKMTQLFTSEWAVRPFIKRYPKETMAFMNACAKDANVHVRRWASEGTRPRLPWGERLQDFIKDPGPTLPILEELKFDNELYVRKSVANHLNDIAKDHPEHVVKILAKWQKQAGKASRAEVDWIIKRSLRTLIKQGHPGALKLIGVNPKAKFKVGTVNLREKKIALGEKIEFSFEVHSLASHPQTLVVDYIIHFMKANSKTAAKVFKLRTFEVKGREKISITKAHPIKKITTREYYSGIHFLEIQINGVCAGRQEWHLSVP